MHDLWRAVRPATTMTSWYVRPGGWTKLGGVDFDAQGLEYNFQLCDTSPSGDLVGKNKGLVLPHILHCFTMMQIWVIKFQDIFCSKIL